MTLRYLSVCSGIEAVSQALHGHGWEPTAFSEIEPFPCAYLAHHYPNVPNLGSMMDYEKWTDLTIDALWGGTPCQAFSVAGLRKGLRDPRGNLTLGFIGVAARYMPRWIVWENVPGVLSIRTDGRYAFGCLLAGLRQLGYSCAYRTLDAVHSGVPQRRRRVFVVAHLGDWRRAAAVLFDRASLSGNFAPGGQAREDVAGTLAARTRGGGGLGTDFDCQGGVQVHGIAGTDQAYALRAQARHSGDKGDGGINTTLVSKTCATLDASYGRLQGASGQDAKHGHSHLIPTHSRPLLAKANSSHDETQETYIPVSATGDKTHALTAEGHDASEDGTGRGVPVIAFDTTQVTSPGNYSNPKPGDPAHPLASKAHPPCIAFPSRMSSSQAADNMPENVSRTLTADNETAIAGPTHGVRRLTPTECERLMGFPDRQTLIPYHGKPAKDSPRYKALGNSMVVPEIRWLGARIKMIDEIK